MTEFRNRGIEIVVDTTHIAELDFADNRISDADQEKVARDLKHILRSDRDRTEGIFRLREVVDGWEVVFTHYKDRSHYVVLVVGYGKKGKMEGTLRLVARAGIEQFAPGAKVLLEGKKRK